MTPAAPIRRPTEHQRFTMVQTMDIGIGSPVVAARDRAFQEAVVCIASMKTSGSIRQWAREKLLGHCALYHPHVLKFYDVFLSENAIHVIFEFPKGCNLLSLLLKQKLVEDQVRHIFQQLAFAVGYYHSMGVEGLDLELESVFLDTDRGTVKTVDFGIWKTNANGQVHSLPYLAPETLHHPSGNKQSRKAADVWTLGVMLYTLLFKKFPFAPSKGTSKQEHIMNILRVNWSVPEGERVTDDCLDLLKKIFQSRENDRITMSGIKNHPWYRTKLPDGVLEYRNSERPDDGLLDKARRLQQLMAA